MDNYFYYFVQTLPECDRLINKYGLDKCLQASKGFCDDLEDGRDLVKYVKGDDKCAIEIAKEAVAKYGARNMYSAFLYLAGDTEAADLHLAAHRFISANAITEINNILTRTTTSGETFDN